MPNNNSYPPNKGLVGLFAISKYFRRAVADAVKIIAIAIGVAIITFTFFLIIISIKGVIINKDLDGRYSVNTCEICDKTKMTQNETN